MAVDKNWFNDYFKLYSSIFSVEHLNKKLLELKNRLVEVNKNKKKIIIAGNGGSAAIASHCAVDFTKNAGIRMISFNESGLITCLSNDYGYADWVSKAIEMYGDEGDLVILISSSGRSENMLNAAKAAKKIGNFVVTFTGFNEDNPLKKIGGLNFWIDSKAYNIIEMTHQIWLLAVCDAIIGKAEYPAS